MVSKDSYLLAKKIIQEYLEQQNQKNAEDKLLKDCPFSKRLFGVIETINKSNILGYQLERISDLKIAFSEQKELLLGIRGLGKKTIEELISFGIIKEE